MTTFTIDNPIIEKNYTVSEIKKKFLYFIETELKEESIDLYEVSVSNLPENVLESYENFDDINFIKR